MNNFEWRVSTSPVPYPEALAEMERRVEAIEKGEAQELFWLLEHPPTYTAGTSAAEDELLDTQGIPVYPAGRGGRYTYHGPGQRVIYVLSDLRKRDRDVRAHVKRMEEWVIRTLAGFGIKGERRCDRIGIWVTRDTADLRNGLAISAPLPFLREGQGAGQDVGRSEQYFEGKQTTRPPLSPPVRTGGGSDRSDIEIPLPVVEEKIGAIGVRVRRWVAYHGLALNVNPDLKAFNGIVPCGLAEFGVASMHALGVKATMQDVDAEFKKRVEEIF